MRFRDRSRRTSAGEAHRRRADQTRQRARAFRWRRLLETGRYTTIDELAAAEKINSSYVSRVVRLTLLAPDIVEAILDGRQPNEMTLAELMKGVAVEWGRQRIAQFEAANTPPRLVASRDG